MEARVESGEERREARQKRRKSRRRIAIVIVLIVILIPALYFLVIPRTDVSVRVFYNESVLNQINVDPQIINTGTNEVESVTLRISVVNSTDYDMGHKEYSITEIAPVTGVAKLDSLTFRGDQYDRYTIIIDIDLTAGGTTQSRHWSHNTEEPWMNQDWTDKVG
jgi:hypothetical protein